MSSLSSICRDLDAALEPSGILRRGAVDFAAGEGPLLATGRHASSVILLGNIGSSIWNAFSRWKVRYDGPDPLDTWSKVIIRPLAEELGGTAYFPSDPPWQPFQQWAMRAEGLKLSPLGILIHPDYGLWHGYRGAIGFSGKIGGDVAVGRHLCDACEAKPCLDTCPANAIATDPARFALSACRSHLAARAGQVGCRISGCIARNACPAGASYRYGEAQIRFHMQALH